MWRALTSALAACAVALGACGSGSDRLTKTEYERAVQSARAKAQALGRFKASDLGQVEDALDVFTDMEGDLRELRPPAEVQDAHDVLVATMERSREDKLEPMLEALRAGDQQEAERIAGEPQPRDVEREAETAFRTFERLGYDVAAMAP